jgi:Tol biopolymer transport system component
MKSTIGLRILSSLLLVLGTSVAQLRITSVEKLPLPSSGEWSHPAFSPSGEFLFYTTLDGNGIWEYSVQSRSNRLITDDPKSGFAFSLSDDGTRLTYRRTTYNGRGRERVQEIILMDLLSRTSSVLASGKDLSVPTFAGNVPVYSVRTGVKNLAKTPAAGIIILGIENTKIALSKNGRKVLLDPFGNGSYIWPVLSPDKQLMVAYEMDRGAFVCDLDGRILNRLGRRDAPSWTRSGKWVIYMDDRDDGEKLLSSDLCAISPNGATVIQLTTTDKVLEMYPQCSPVENKIACSSADGQIYLLTYEER